MELEGVDGEVLSFHSCHIPLVLSIVRISSYLEEVIQGRGSNIRGIENSPMVEFKGSNFFFFI